MTEENIERPVVMLADRHSSRFDFKVLQYSRENQIFLFFTPPDTTGVTQLLDQEPNQRLHREYKKRDELFPGFQTINREGFMNILGEMWDQWAPEQTIVNAAKRVGISKVGLNVENMQQDKFQQAANIMATEDSPEPGPSTPKRMYTRSSTNTPESTSCQPTTPVSMSKLARSKHKYGSAGY